MSEFSDYTLLSEYYDRFTDDVPYGRWADFFESIFAQRGCKPEIILDLACGTGTMTRILSERGYDVIAVDQSEDMLMAAMDEFMDAPFDERPMFICQPMQELELAGSVDACVCCLDSVNYVTEPDILREAFRRVREHLVPDGLFVFDINTRAKLERIDGQSFVREDEDVFCVWQSYIEGDDLCHYDFDIFELNEQGAWNRYQEHHAERIYEIDFLTKLLEDSGFDEIEVRGELSEHAPAEDEERVFFIARAGKGNEE